MKYYVTQFGTFFYELKKVKGYTGDHIFLGTQISAEEYKKLFYLGGERETAVSPSKQVQCTRVMGDCRPYINKQVQTVLGS